MGGSLLGFCLGLGLMSDYLLCGVVRLGFCSLGMAGSLTAVLGGFGLGGCAVVACATGAAVVAQGCVALGARDKGYVFGAGFGGLGVVGGRV
jgi:hypothetical protein